MKIFKKLTVFCLPCCLLACSTLPTPVPEKPPRATTVQPVIKPKTEIKVVPVDQAIKANPVVLSLLDRAQQQIRDGNESAAESTLERAIRIAPRYPESYFRLAQLRYKQGRYEQASALAEKSLSLGADKELRRLAQSLINSASSASK